jgi:hypothetical protein
MEQQLSPGVKVLNGFLRVMVTLLVGILLTVFVSFILWTVGIF